MGMRTPALIPYRRCLCAIAGRVAIIHSATASTASPSRFIPKPPGKKGILAVLGPSRLAPLLEIGSVKSRGDRACAAGDNTHNIRCHLKKATGYLQPGRPLSDAGVHDFDNPLPQEGHKRGMAGENPYQAVIRRCHNGFRIALEHRPLGGDHGDAHYAVAIFLACATTSSIPPCM